MAAGEIVLTATYFENNHFTGFPVANVADGDFTTFWAGNTSLGGDYIGVDAGTAVVPTGVLIAPRRKDFMLRDSNGIVVGGSNTSQSAGYAALYTNTGCFPANVLTEIPLSTGGSSYRWLRVLGPSGNFNDCAELYFIVQWTTGLTGKCVKPTASPAGGKYSSSQTVTLACRTTDASLYYTTDGSTPTTGSTLYTVPFSVSTGTTLKVIAASTGVSNSDVATFFFQALPLADGNYQYDVTDGTMIQAHDGRIFKTASYFYWFGTERRCGTGTDNWHIAGVNLYRSTDLANWTRLGQAIKLTQVRAFDSTIVVLERPTVRYNASTGKYVLWGHADTSGYGTAKAYCATADNPEGPYTVVYCAKPDGNEARDIYFFVDGANAYLYYSSDSNTSIKCSPLDSTWTTPAGSPVTILASGREAEVVVKVGSVYFLQTSGTAGFVSSASIYYTSSSPTGTFTSAGSPFLTNASPSDTTSFNSQLSDIFQDAAGNWVAFGDRWDTSDLSISKYVWWQVSISGSTMSITYAPSFTPVGITPPGGPYPFFTDNGLTGGMAQLGL